MQLSWSPNCPGQNSGTEYHFTVCWYRAGFCVAGGQVAVRQAYQVSYLTAHFHKKRSVTLRELQSLIGFLNFCCSVVIPVCAFLRRLIDLTSGLTRPHHHLHLNRESKHDIRMWLTFLDNFNGRAFFLSDRWENSSTLDLKKRCRGL